MTISPQDILLYAGGAALERYGTFSRRTVPISRRGEDIQETVARASVATYVDQGGVVRDVATGILRPHWPLVSGSRELHALLEASRENEFTRSAEFDHANWTKTRSSITANQHTAPDGTTTADRLVEDATASSTHYVFQTVTVTADANYACTVYGKDVGGGRNWIRVFVGDDAAAFTNYAAVYVNVATGAIGTTGAGGTGAFVAAYVDALADGWYRCTVVGSVGNSATAIRGKVLLANGDDGMTYNGDGSSYLAIWGGQFEDSVSEPSSYIATTTAAVTRAADDCYIDWLLSPQACTIYKRFIEGEAPTWATSHVLSHIGLTTINTDPRLALFKVSGSDNYRVAHDNGTTNAASDLDLNPSRGDVVELIAELSADGSVQLHGALNLGSLSSGTASAANAMASAWAGQRYYFNGINTNSVGFQALRADIVVRGTGYSLADFRALLP